MQPFGAFANLKLHLLTFFQGLVPIHIDCREMYEYILFQPVGFYEPVSLALLNHFTTPVVMFTHSSYFIYSG